MARLDREPTAEGVARFTAPQVARTPLRWMATVFASVAASTGLLLTGVHPVVPIAVAVAVTFGAVSDAVFDHLRTTNDQLHDGLGARLEHAQAVVSRRRVEAATHGRLDQIDRIVEPLCASASNDAALRAAIAKSVGEIAALEEGIRRDLARSGLRDDQRPTLLGGLAAERAAREGRERMRRFGDPMNLPDWLRRPGARDLVTRVGTVLDDVRLMHDAQLEWVVLLFTLWSRLLIVGFAPLLGAVSFGAVPLAGGVSVTDVPWVMAVMCCAATAAVAPSLAAGVMQRDAEGRELRRILLAIEVPIAVAALLATPCSPVTVFVVGWTNWWQRPEFSWARLPFWVAGVLGLLLLGAALSHQSLAGALADGALAMVVIALTSNTYGAVLPISAGLMARVLVGGLLARRAADSRTERELDETIGHIRDAARVVEAYAERTGTPRDESRQLAEIADGLARQADREARWARRTPRGLGALIASALDRAGPAAESHQAELDAAAAVAADRSPPLVTTEPTFYDRSWRFVRIGSRRQANALARLIVEVVVEARRYGTGPLCSECRLEDGRLVLRFSNRIARDVRPSGRGTGTVTREELARRFGGTIEAGLVDGRFAGLHPQLALYGVVVHLPSEMHSVLDTE